MANIPDNVNKRFNEKIDIKFDDVYDVNSLSTYLFKHICRSGIKKIIELLNYVLISLNNTMEKLDFASTNFYNGPSKNRMMTNGMIYSKAFKELHEERLKYNIGTKQNYIDEISNLINTFSMIQGKVNNLTSYDSREQICKSI